MKPKARRIRFLSFTGSSLLAAASAFVSLPNANAAEYWWNQNGTTEGWGVGGTWDTTSAVFSTTNSDTASAAAAATTTSDTLNFGTSTVGFAGGTITANGATRNIGTIVTGSANNTADINLTNIRLSFADPGTITNNSPRALAISGIIIGTATRLDLNANGGDIQLTGSGSTYSGITYINSGTVMTNNADNLGASGSDSNRTVIASGARLLFNNNRTYTERFEIAGAGVGGTTGAFYNSGNRSTALNGQVTLSGNATTCSDSTANALTFGGGIVLGANALTFNSVNAGSIQTVQTNAISGATGSVVKTGSGVLNLNVASSYTGGTTLNAGTINIGAAISGSDSAIGSISGTLTVNGGTLNMAGNNVTVGNLTGTGGVISGTTGTRTLTIGQGDGGGGNFQGAIQNGSGGTTALTKTGSGAITLSGNNTYTGTTNVNGGTLLINGSTSSTSLVTVNNGGTLGGTGTIGGSVTLNDGAFLTPGASIESLATGSNVWNGGSTFVFEFSTDGSTGASGTEWDLLAITGNLDLSGASVGNSINFDLVTMANVTTGGLLGTWNPNASAVWSGFVTTTGGITGFAANLFNIDTSGFQNTINGSFSIAKSGNNLDLIYTAVPEPRAALIGGLGLLMLLRRRR